MRQWLQRNEKCTKPAIAITNSVKDIEMRQATVLNYKKSADCPEMRQRVSKCDSDL